MRVSLTLNINIRNTLDKVHSKSIFVELIFSMQQELLFVKQDSLHEISWRYKNIQCNKYIVISIPLIKIMIRMFSVFLDFLQLSFL